MYNKISYLTLKLSGALTIKSYAFKARPWELRRTKSIDLSDSLGSHVLIETKNKIVFRVLPRLNNQINEEWLSDKARYIFDGLTNSRIKQFYFKTNNIIEKNAFLSIQKTKKNKFFFSVRPFFFSTFSFFLSSNLDLNIITEAKLKGRFLGKSVKSEINANNLINYPSLYQSSCSLKDSTDLNFCLVEGIDMRKEAILANLRFRLVQLKSKIKFYTLGFLPDLNYKHMHVGVTKKFKILSLEGKHSFSKNTKKQILYVYGDSLNYREDSHSSLILSFLCQKYLSINSFIHSIRFGFYSNSIGLDSVGYNKTKNINNSYFIGCEEKKFLRKAKNYTNLVQSTHADFDVNFASFLIPLQSHMEVNGLYINYEGLNQKSSAPFVQPSSTFQLLNMFISSLKEKKSRNIPRKISNILKKKELFFISFAGKSFLKIIIFYSLTYKMLKTPVKTICTNSLKTTKGTKFSISLLSAFSKHLSQKSNFTQNIHLD